MFGKCMSKEEAIRRGLIGNKSTGLGSSFRENGERNNNLNPNRYVKHLKEVQIPEIVKRFVLFEDFIYDLRPENINDAAEHVINNYHKNEYKIALQQIVNCAEFTPLNTNLLGELFAMISLTTGATCDLKKCPKYFKGTLISNGLDMDKVSEEIKYKQTPFDEGTPKYYVMFDQNDKIDFSKVSNDDFGRTLTINLKKSEKDEQPIGALNFAANYGAVKCFNSFLEKDYKISDETKKFAIKGGSIEIINTLERKRVSFDKLLNVAIGCHKNDLADWLIDNYKCESIDLENALKARNLRAILFLIQNKEFGNDSFALKELILDEKSTMEKDLPIVLAAFEGHSIDKRILTDLIFRLCENNDLGYLESLDDNGIDINPITERMESGLSFNGPTERIQNNTDSLYIAIRKSKPELAELVLAKCQSKTHDNVCYLGAAVKSGKANMIEFVFNHGLLNSSNLFLREIINCDSSFEIIKQIDKHDSSLLNFSNAPRDLRNLLRRDFQKNRRDAVEFYCSKNADFTSLNRIINRKEDLALIKYAIDHGYVFCEDDTDVLFERNEYDFVLENKLPISKETILRLDTIPEKYREKIFSEIISRKEIVPNVLSLIIRNGSMEMLKKVVETGVNINVEDDRGDYILETAIMREKNEMMKYLIEKGADINVRNGKILIRAIKKSFDTFKSIVEGNPNYDPSDPKIFENIINNKPHRYEEILDYLIQNGVNLRSTQFNRSPLYTAINNKDLSLLQKLLDNGVDPNVVFDNDGSTNINGRRRLRTPLLSAIERRFDEAFEPLINAGADINFRINNTKRTPLAFACRTGRLDMVEKLVKKGADMYMPSSRREVLPLVDSRRRNDDSNIIRIAQIFADAGYNFNYVDKNDKTILCYNNFSPSVIRFFIDHGADPNFVNKDGRTPLHFQANSNVCIRNGPTFGGRIERTDNMRVLIDKGANLDVKAQGLKPIGYLNENSNKELYNLLLSYTHD